MKGRASTRTRPVWRQRANCRRFFSSPSSVMSPKPGKPPPYTRGAPILSRLGLRWGSNQSGNAGSQSGYSLTGLRRGEVNFLQRRRVLGGFRRGFGQRRLAVPGFEFITLGEDQAIGDGGAIEQFHHRQVVVHHAPP